MNNNRKSCSECEDKIGHQYYINSGNLCDWCWMVENEEKWALERKIEEKQARIIFLTSIINITSILKTREKMKDFIEIIILTLLD